MTAIMNKELYDLGGMIFEQKFNDRVRACMDFNEVHDLYDNMLEQTAYDAWFNGLDYGTMDPALAYFAVVEYYPENIANTFLDELIENEWI